MKCLFVKVMTHVCKLALTNQSLLAVEARSLSNSLVEAWSSLVNMCIAVMALITGVISYVLCLFMVEAMCIGLLEMVYDVRDIGDILYPVFFICP